ncbi:MAG: 2-oxo acid dehydrogenase subunit E2 [Chloroflexota bacterium]|nr:2-oxo acid dehydrogenase subunit E2 [Chloroflexota bacterium]
MATKIIMPKLGMAMSNGKVVKWLREDGAEVKKDEPVVVVMSKKITYEVVAPADGIVRHISRAKDTCDIGQIIGFVTDPGEEIPKVDADEKHPATAPAEGPVETKAPAPAAPAKEKVKAPKEEKFVPSSPAARRLARELGVDISRVGLSGSRITEADVQRFYDEQAQISISPLARQMAEVEELDITTIQGSGPNGKIIEEDILRMLEGAKPKAVAENIPFIGMRQAIAEQMVYSLQTMAQITLTTQVDVTELKSTRQALRVRWDRKVSYTDLLVKAVAVALDDHPLLGARLVPESEEIVMPDEINVGVAVALEGGLIVPVVRNADRMTVPEIGDKIKDLAQRARENALDVDEVTGAAFTVTNLGMYGVDGFTPIINPPEVAILGVGRIAEELALVNGQVAARSKMTLSLTIDHRIVDGAPGAAFLQTLTQLLEHPALIFAKGEK